MAFQDFLLRARRPASLVAFNGALPSNFKLAEKINGVWQLLSGVNLGDANTWETPTIALVPQVLNSDGTVLIPAVMSPDMHYNLRVTDAWSGWDRLDRTKFKTWFKNNGVEKLDTAAEHPRSGRTMRWFRWTAPNGIDWVDAAIDAPAFQRNTMS